MSSSSITNHPAAQEPIAIVGIGCRYPGGVNSPERFWELLRDGINVVGDIPFERFSPDSEFSEGSVDAGTLASRKGGFLPDVDLFDASFFGIAPREADQMDPQQRLLLETAWRALEDAGLRQEQLAGSRTGVYIGVWLSDYEASLYDTINDVELHTTTGGGRYAAAGRLSYALDLRGPSLTVDTACSSSLVAVHLAVQSLRAGETRVSLAGGVNVILQPQISIAYSGAGMLAPDGNCKFGDAHADGYVRSEGCGVVVLKRLHDAMEDGDRIYAVVQGSAVNNDGQGSGLLVQPSTIGQAEMLRAAYADAGVNAGLVGYVEAHGTGTLAGDPVELQAIGTVLGEGRADDNRCFVGSVKTNLGHTEGAAGVAGLIKVALSIQHGEVPASLHFQTPSPRVPWDDLAISIPTSLSPWPVDGERRYAGVSSFGITGTNAHIVLADMPAQQIQHRLEHADDRPTLLPISARSETALRELAQTYAKLLRRPDTPAVRDIAFTAATRRSHLPERLAVVGGSHEQVAERLTAFANGDSASGIARATTGIEEPRLAYVFPGQGGQWIGMGRRLAEMEPAFAAALNRCDAAIRAETGWSLLEELGAPAETSRLSEIGVVQPAIFAIQVALAELLADWGLHPDIVVGHSMGEIAAAHVAGILSLEDAAAVICRRSRLMERIAGHGAMGVVQLSLLDATALVDPFNGRLSVAASNGPTTTVISGDPEAVDEALAVVKAQGGFARRVQVDVASHSAQVDPLLDELKSILNGLSPCTARTRFASTVTGTFLQGGEMDAVYWSRNLRQPVLLAPVVSSILNEGATVLLELSPHPVLLGSLESATGAANESVAVGALRRDQDEAETLREAVGTLWTSGISVDWERIEPGQVTLPLPVNPWQRERYWFTDTVQSTRRTAARLSVRTDTGSILGHSLPDLAHLPGSRFWQHQVEPADLSSGTAQISGTPILSGTIAAMFCGAAAAAASGSVATQLEVGNQPFLTEPTEIQSIVSHASEESEVHIFTRSGDDDRWVPWAKARLTDPPARPDATNIPEIQARLSRGQAAVGGHENVWRSSEEILARLSQSEVEEQSASLLDVVNRLLCIVGDDSDHLLFGAEFVGVYTNIDDATWLYVSNCTGNISSELMLLNDNGDVVAEIRGSRIGPPDEEMKTRASINRVKDFIYSVEWRPVDLIREPGVINGKWLVVADEGGFGEELAKQFSELGAATELLVTPAGDTESLVRQLRQTSLTESETWSGIVDLRMANPPSGELQDLAENQVRLVLELVQAVSLSQPRSTPRLWLVTRGAQSVDGPPLNPASAALWGFGRVIANEYPELWGGIVDLDPTPGEHEASILSNILAHQRSEDELAIRSDKVFAARLTRCPGLASQPAEFDADATYLVTGGVGGIGLAIARGMIDAGARHLALIGRRSLDPRIENEIGLLEQTGASVTYFRADISRADDVEALFELIRRDFPPLRGIVHGAAVLADATIMQQSADALHTVFAPKVAGAENLIRAVEHDSLEFVALFSSASALLGTPGQSNYAAANSVVDAYSHLLRANGIPAISIAWGRWGDIGLAATGDNSTGLDQLGLEAIPGTVGVAAFGQVIRAETPYIGVFDIDWSTFMARDSVVRPRLSEVIPAGNASDPGARSEPRDRMLGRLKDAHPDDRVDMMLDHIRSLVATVLGFQDHLRVPPGRGFFQIGMDSLTAVELKNRLQHSLGLTLTATTAFDYPTPVTLARHLTSELFPEEGNSELLVDAEHNDLSGLSREDLRDLLDAELEAITEEFAR